MFTLIVSEYDIWLGRVERPTDLQVALRPSYVLRVRFVVTRSVPALYLRLFQERGGLPPLAISD